MGYPLECSCTTYGYDIDLDSNGNSYVSGAHLGALNLGSNLVWYLQVVIPTVS